MGKFSNSDVDVHYVSLSIVFCFWSYLKISVSRSPFPQPDIKHLQTPPFTYLSLSHTRGRGKWSHTPMTDRTTLKGRWCSCSTYTRGPGRWASAFVYSVEPVLWAVPCAYQYLKLQTSTHNEPASHCHHPSFGTSWSPGKLHLWYRSPGETWLDSSWQA